jgi:hypothetical protein
MCEMADLIIVHELGSGEPILLNSDAIVKGREHNDAAHGIYSSLDLIDGKSVTIRGSLETLRKKTL